MDLIIIGILCTVFVVGFIIGSFLSFISINSKYSDHIDNAIVAKIILEDEIKQLETENKLLRQANQELREV